MEIEFDQTYSVVFLSTLGLHTTWGGGGGRALVGDAEEAEAEDQVDAQFPPHPDDEDLHAAR